MRSTTAYDDQFLPDLDVCPQRDAAIPRPGHDDVMHRTDTQILATTAGQDLPKGDTNDI